MKQIRSLALLCIVSVVNPVYADRKDQPISLQKSMFAQENNKQISDMTRDKVSRIKVALKRYYVKNMSRWPSNLSDISSVYDGDFKTPAGQVVGGQNGLRYSLTINVRSTDTKLVTQLASMAERNHGSLSGSILTFNIESDQSIAAMESSLSRYVDPSGELNKMYTDINVNSQDINNVNNISVNGSQIGTANFTDAILTTETVDFKSVADTNTVTNDTTGHLNVTNNNLADSTVDSLVVTNTNSVNNTATINANSGINVNGVMLVDSAGQLYLDGQDLNARFVGINEKVINSAKLGGYDASLFVRKDATNYFTATQKFNGGLSASTIATSALATGTVSVNNRFKTNTGTVGNIKVGNDWFSNTKNRSHTNENEIRNLENIGSIRRVGTWRYKGTSRTGGAGAINGAVCLHINSWGHEAYQGTERVCWGGSGSDNSSGGCRDKTVTKYRSYQCR